MKEFKKQLPNPAKLLPPDENYVGTVDGFKAIASVTEAIAEETGHTFALADDAQL